MSINNIGRALNHSTLGEMRRTHVRKRPSKNDPKPTLPPAPETIEQRKLRERRASAARLAARKVNSVGWMVDLDASARAWAPATPDERVEIITAFAAIYPRAYSTAQRQIAKRARDMGLAIRMGRNP